MTDPMTPERLAEIEQRANQWASPLVVTCPSCGSAPGDRCYGNGSMSRPHDQRREAARLRVIADVPALLAEVRRLQAAAERVREMHAGEPYAQGPDYCDECEHKWPCPTIRALGIRP